MNRLSTILILTSLAAAPAAFAATPGASADPAPNSAVTTTASVGIPASLLPPLPHGRSTVIGGLIGAVDPVRDQLTLRVYGGGKPMKVLFDERTQVFRDGQKTDLADLKPEDRAAVETVLDGNDVFALSVHMLSRAPQGEARGQVLSYDPRDGALTISDSISHQPVKLYVQQQTSIARIGQPGFAAGSQGRGDLMRGTLVTASFQPNNQGQGVADKVSVLAVPGTEFTFAGNISYLDLSARKLVVSDPRDDKSYTIFFDSAADAHPGDLHEGSKIMVKAHFDGVRYTASTITNN